MTARALTPLRTDIPKCVLTQSQLQTWREAIPQRGPLFRGQAISSGYPWGMFATDVLGAFLMGVIAETFALKVGLSKPLRLFLTTGILGGFTTFSTYALETALLRERGELGAALAYALGCGD